jgi:hypothetical protein
MSLESSTLMEFIYRTLAGRKKFYRAGEALSAGGLKFLAFFGYFLW